MYLKMIYNFELLMHRKQSKTDSEYNENDQSILSLSAISYTS